MERQAAYGLFSAFLPKRGDLGIDLDKDLTQLLDHAQTEGFFTDPHRVHEIGEWRRYGDRLWERVLEDDKIAKKMSKIWRVVHNELLMSQAEKKAVAEARLAQDRNSAYAPLPLSSLPPDPSAPNPPVTSSITLPATRGKNSIDRQSFPGALSDLAEAMSRERRELWSALAKQGLDSGDLDLAEAAQAQAHQIFPVLFHPLPDGGQKAEVTQLDWKMLAQLRSTVAQFGITSEPARQMIDYMFNSALLLPADIKGITRLIYTPHQKILFNTRWQEEAAASAAQRRPVADPLHDLTVDQLLGQGAFLRLEDQAALGAEKLREVMAVAKRAMEKIREPGGVPMYMGIKQGREESLGSFVDKIVIALNKAGITDHMQEALLRQCVIQNGNAATRSLISTSPGNWTVQDLLDRAASMPTGSQVFLASALDKIGEGLKTQAKTQQQVLVALHPSRHNVGPLETASDASAAEKQAIFGENAQPLAFGATIANLTRIIPRPAAVGRETPEPA
ncbi:endogenous retrovirus group K member 8 Gag polyprotein-like protein [Turdus rufiventris]|nr:endogenous retrovirus group K member 8 Gag polyprotein-like protein [Turdus rufiventris]